MSGTRAGAIAAALAAFDDGRFLADLARRIAIPSESQNPERAAELELYLAAELTPALERLGYRCRILPNPAGPFGPFLIAERHEADGLPGVFTYGHGDVIRGQESSWRTGLDPWRLTREGDRLYGRGIADNKGQHSVNLAALAAVIGERGRLGFNSKILIETGEETGSPGLREICAAERAALRADVLIASDGPRVAPDRPTLFLGSRGSMNVDLTVDLREGGHHSGNWGGVLPNPGLILAHALASIVGSRGEIKLAALRPAPMTAEVRAALAGLPIDGGPDGPQLDPDWGEPGLTPPERLWGHNSFEILAYRTGDPDRPVNAIPPRASAHCNLRFVVGTDPNAVVPALRAHFDANGFPMVKVSLARAGFFNATRTAPDHPWVKFAESSLARTLGRAPAILPNLGGALPNDVFTDVLDLPTVWVPHSYAGCSQHAPNEHLPASLLREGLAIMAGLFWDVGAGGAPVRP